MAKLHFYYSSMNAGKTTALLQSSYNYRERGMRTLVLAPDLDDRQGVGKVTSRIGLEMTAVTFGQDDDLFKLVAARIKESSLHCVLLDEAQFLTKEQVFQLGEIADKLDIPVSAYGIRTDSKESRSRAVNISSHGPILSRSWRQFVFVGARQRWSFEWMRMAMQSDRVHRSKSVEMTDMSRCAGGTSRKTITGRCWCHGINCRERCRRKRKGQAGLPFL